MIPKTIADVDEFADAESFIIDNMGGKLQLVLYFCYSVEEKIKSEGSQQLEFQYNAAHFLYFSALSYVSGKVFI